MQSKLNASHRAGDLKNVQFTKTRDMHEHCILLDVPHIKSPFAEWPDLL